jgi:hypothetical protein
MLRLASYFITFASLLNNKYARLVRHKLFFAPDDARSFHCVAPPTKSFPEVAKWSELHSVSRRFWVAYFIYINVYITLLVVGYNSG